MNQEQKQPETVEQAAKEYERKLKYEFSPAEHFEAGVDWHVSQHSYTEQKTEDYYHGIYEYCGDEFEDSLGDKIHVWDDHSNPGAPCYKIQFSGSNEVHGNMDDSDIDWTVKHDIIPLTYTQEQMLAFGEAVKGAIMELQSLDDYDGLTPYRWVDLGDIERIDISKLLNK